MWRQRLNVVCQRFGRFHTIFKDLAVPESLDLVRLNLELVGYLGYTKVNKTGSLF